MIAQPAQSPIEEQAAYPQFMPYNPVEPVSDVTLVTQTDPKKVLEDIEHFYRGEVFNYEEKKWVKKGEPLMNEDGIASFLIDIASLVNQNTILSNLSEHEINRIIILFSRTIINKLSMKWKEFNIDKTNFDTIWNTTLNMAYMALKRAMNQGERNYHKKIIYAPQIMRTGQPVGKEGGMSKIKSLFK